MLTDFETVETYALRRAQELCDEHKLGRVQVLSKQSGLDSSKLPDSYSCYEAAGQRHCGTLRGLEIHAPYTEVLFKCGGSTSRPANR
jgi:hypothetical protein